MNKFKYLLHSFLPLIAMIAVQAIVSFVSVLIWAIVEWKGEYAKVNFENQVLKFSNDGVVVSLISATFTTMILGIIWYKKVKDNTDEESTDNKILYTSSLNCIKILDIVNYLWVSFGCTLVISIALMFLGRYIPNEMADYEELILVSGIGSDIWVILMAVMIAPIGEECLFRGVTLERTKKVGKFYVANILQAFLFALAHMNLVQGFYVFLLGIVFGYIKEKYQSIIPAIICHIAFNIFGQIIPSIISGFTPSMLVILFVIGSLLIAYSMKYFSKLDREQN